MRKALFGVLAAAFLAGCEIPEHQSESFQPKRPTIEALRNRSIVIIVRSTLTYTAKDEGAFKGELPYQVLERLNSQGQADGNTFSLVNGNEHNFTFEFTIHNDGNNNFTGSLAFSGWGWGHISTFYSQYQYTDTSAMIDALTDQAYNFIHLGWHES